MYIIIELFVICHWDLAFAFAEIGDKGTAFF